MQYFSLIELCNHPLTCAHQSLPLPSLSPSATHFQRYRVSKPTNPINCRHQQIRHCYQPDTDIPSYASTQSIPSSALAPRDSPLLPTPESPLPRPTAFTEKQEKRRRNHLTSEKKRRENIKLGMSALFDLVPTCVDKSESKAQVLRKTTAYILELKSEVETLKKEREKFRVEGGLAMAQMGADRA